MASMLRLDFSAEAAPVEELETSLEPTARRDEPVATPPLASQPAAAAMHLFGDEPELPPTWSEGSSIYHTSEKCARLKAIQPNNRLQGKPGVREHCLFCKDIAATKRRG